jgi:hypothetical protein
MNTRRWMISFLGGALLLASTRAPLAAPKAEMSTTDFVRGYVLGIHHLMEKLSLRQHTDEHPEVAGNCKGYPIGPAIKRSVALSYMRKVIGGKALNCYLATYLGCNAGEWVGRPTASAVYPNAQPFKRSKVTIIEDTRDRIVADVTELSSEELFDDVPTDMSSEDEPHPFTEAEIDAITIKSRYTITRGKDGHWRITDRKPNFKWVCDASLDKE